jgi:hypothetical protein
VAIIVGSFAVPIAIFWMTNGEPAMIGTVFADWALTFSSIAIENQGNPLFIISTALSGFLLILPLIGIGFVFIGPLYGISKEIVESGSTSGENAFAWLRKKFVQFALTGVGMALIIGGPVAAQWTVTILVFGSSPDLLIQSLSAGLSIGYMFLAYGLVANWLPAVTDGQTVSQGLNTSIDLLRSHPERIYGVLLGFLSLLAVVILPVSIVAYFSGPSFVLPFPGNPISVIALSYTALSGLFVTLIGVPAHFIMMTRMYMMLSGQSVTEYPLTAEPEISLMGG